MFSSEVFKDEFDNPDTLTKGPDDDLNHDEYSGVEEDIFGQHHVSDVTEEKDSTIVFHEESIENIIKAVNENAGNSPSRHISAEKENAKGSNAGQVDVSQGRPIVVINILAASLGLGGRDGKLDIGDVQNKPLKNTDLVSVEVDKSIPEDPKSIAYEDESNVPDYFDFDTDYITIMLESDYQAER